MIQNLQNIQKYYWEGRAYEESHNYKEAIAAYITYSSYLSESDQHIPHQWISKLYSKLNQVERALEHLEIFADGCSPPRAAEVYKEIGSQYLEINRSEQAIKAYENAIQNNPNIGVKKQLESLKNNQT